ncbi:MAG: type IV secretion system DNA-binding domain-containing protein [Rhizomicrobium sp.]
MFNSTMAEWISKAIGDIEIERYRETRTHGQFPQSRNSESQQRDISREPLVMASEISGLDPLHGYRVLIHADTELGAKDLLNNRMAYVAVSRGAYDAQIFTNDREKLGAALGHDVSHTSAHVPEMKPEQKQEQEQAVTPQREIAAKQEQGEDFGLGL